MRGRVFSYICFALAAAEMIVIVGSWVIGVLMPDSGMRSMLSSDSIRWFFSNFISFVSGEVLAWILLLSMAWSSVKACGIFSSRRLANGSSRLANGSSRHLSANGNSGRLSVNDKVAMACAAVSLLFCVAVVLLLTVVPHAALLSVSGSIYPSPFSKSLVAIVAFIAIFTSIVYGVMSGRYRRVTDVFLPFRDGVASSAWLVVVYVFAAQLFFTLIYILP